jgi:hypothetical protein
MGWLERNRSDMSSAWRAHRVLPRSRRPLAEGGGRAPRQRDDEESVRDFADLTYAARAEAERGSSPRRGHRQAAKRFISPTSPCAADGSTGIFLRAPG